MSPRTVLLVDDDEDIRESLALVLEDLGWCVLTARNGREALAALCEMTPLPQLIMLDMTMPVMNGWQFLEQREREARLTAVPVMVMTAARDAAVEAANVAAVVRKPVSYEQLVGAIQAAVA